MVGSLHLKIWKIAIFIPWNRCIFEIPQKVVFFEMFLHWFKCKDYSLYDMIFFPKIQLEKPYIRCTWDSNWMPKEHWKCMGNNKTKNCVFYKQYICSVLQFSKFDDFLCLCWFLVKNLSNFVPLHWKLHNRYCHNSCTTICVNKYVSGVLELLFLYQLMAEFI